MDQSKSKKDMNIKTAECVSPKHPDKMCDQISDWILDYCLGEDPRARVAIETMGGHGKVYITGEVSFDGDIEKLKHEIPYIVHEITGEKEEVEINIVEQSHEIANGVDTGGAGDQGIMVGYACRDNEAMIPHEMFLARSLCQYIYQVYPYDGKTQITIHNNIITKVVASFQNVPKERLKELVIGWLGDGSGLTDEDIICNPAGDWTLGGFEADTGLTGRKLIVDNYGPQIPIGGGAFSGKDATKVDRSGAYMARKLAVRLLKEYPNQTEVYVKVAYAIGKEDPVMITVDTVYDDGTTKHTELVMDEWNGISFKPKEMIKLLGLNKPIFGETAKWGHFGNNFIWER